MTIRGQYRQAWQRERMREKAAYYYSDGLGHYENAEFPHIDVLQIDAKILGVVQHQLKIRDTIELHGTRYDKPFWERQLFQDNPRHTQYLSLMAWRCYGIEALTVVACWEGYLKNRKDGAWVRHIV